MAKIGLYYPFIHFRNEGWLKLSALYWDSMRRLVPEGYALQDSDEVQALVKSGFVRIEEPNLWSRHTGQLFNKLLEDYLDQLSPLYDVRHCKAWPKVQNGQLPVGRNPHLAYIHAEKMPKGLAEKLRKSCLAASFPKDWLGMHPHLVRAYMFELARHAAKGRGAELVSDDESSLLGISASSDNLARSLLGRIDLGRRAQDPSSDGAQTIFTMVLRNVVPKDIAKVPAKKIVELRKEYGPARAALQRYSKELAQSLDPAIITSKTKLRLHVREEYEKTLGPELDKLKAALGRRGYSTAVSAVGLSFGVPGLIATIPTLPVTAPLLALAGGAVLLAGLVHKEQEAAAATLEKSPAAYLLKVEELKPTTLATTIARKLRKFTLAV